MIQFCAGALRQLLDVELGAGHRRGDERDRAGRVLEHLRDERLQIVLGVDDVAERRVVRRQHNGRRLAERLAADRARVLQRDRVPLLRHDAAALHEPVRQPQVAELHRAPQQQILDDAAEADEQDGGGAHALEQVVDRRDAAVGVARRRRRTRAARRVRSRSIGKPVPVIAHAPSGFWLVLA